MDVIRVTVEQDGPTRFGYTYAACQHRQVGAELTAATARACWGRWRDRPGGILS